MISSRQIQVFQKLRIFSCRVVEKSANQLGLFPFFTMAGNDRGYGHWRFAGAFAVVKRQSECGRKTR